MHEKKSSSRHVTKRRVSVTCPQGAKYAGGGGGIRCDTGDTGGGGNIRTIVFCGHNNKIFLLGPAALEGLQGAKSVI